MKKFLFLMLALAVVGCNKEQGYNLKISLEDAGGQQIILQQSIPGDLVSLDSVMLDSAGVGEISGTIEKAEMMYLSVAGQRGRIPVFLDNYDYTIAGTMRENVIEAVGGPQVEYNTYKEGLKGFGEKQMEISNRYRMVAAESADEAALEAIVEEYNAVEAEVKAYDSLFITQNPASVVSAYLIRNIYHMLSVEELEKWMGLLDSSLESSVYYVMLDEHLVKMKNVSIGSKFIDFELPDPDGNMVKVSSLAGNGVLLIDFWAAWCGPCRRANPGVVELYNQYHDKGFDILGVSLDNDRAAWLKAIADDGLVWTQISDIKGWNCAGSQLYAVNSIPHTVLIGQDGTILAKNLSKEELKAKLEELLVK